MSNRRELPRNESFQFSSQFSSNQRPANNRSDEGLDSVNASEIIQNNYASNYNSQTTDSIRLLLKES